MGNLFSTYRELTELDSDRITLPKGTKTLTRSLIRENTMYCTQYLRISEGPTRLGDSAFVKEVFGYKSISLPQSLTDIGDKAFFNCDSLTRLTLPPHIKSIGIAAFGRCWGLTSLNIPKGVTRIQPSTFFMCGRLSNITFSGPITHIGSQAFVACKFKQFTLPNTVIEIGDNAFFLCRQLETLTLPAAFCTAEEKARLGLEATVRLIPHEDSTYTPRTLS